MLLAFLTPLCFIEKISESMLLEIHIKRTYDSDVDRIHVVRYPYLLINLKDIT